MPLATIALQKLCADKLHISSADAMTAAEQLYAKGLISYPRTETERFSPDFDLRSLINEQRPSAEWGPFAARLIDDDGFDTPSAGAGDDKAHPPIHPLKCVQLSELAETRERRIYELVVRHFLACCARDAKGEASRVDVGLAEETFSAHGTIIRERNWLDVYPYSSWSNQVIPPFAVGDAFVPTSLMMDASRTVAPPLLSEAQLLSMMDANKIGTDATCAQHIKTIEDRKYAERVDPNRQHFRPTPIGVALVEAYEQMNVLLNKPALRQTMEADCRAISLGHKRKDDVVKDCLTEMLKQFQALSRGGGGFEGAFARRDFRRARDTPLDLSRARAVRRGFSLCGTCGGQLNLIAIAGSGRGSSLGGAPSSEEKLALHCMACNRAHKLMGSATARTQQQVAVAEPPVQARLLAVPRSARVVV